MCMGVESEEELNMNEVPKYVLMPASAFTVASKVAALKSNKDSQAATDQGNLHN